MALTPEDKKDVKGAMGKALANKVSKVTRDYKGPTQSRHFADLTGKHRKQSDVKRIGRGTIDLAEGRYVKLRPSSVRNEGIGKAQTTAFSPHRPNKYRGKYPGEPELEHTPTKYTKNY